jgi:hypothetical protein
MTEDRIPNDVNDAFRLITIYLTDNHYHWVSVDYLGTVSLHALESYEVKTITGIGLSVMRRTPGQIDIENIAMQLHRTMIQAKLNGLSNSQIELNIPFDVWIFLLYNYPEWYVADKYTEVFGDITLLPAKEEMERVAANIRRRMTRGSIRHIIIGNMWYPVLVKGNDISLSSKGVKQCTKDG